MSRYYRWTNFVKGPNLHDTVADYSTVDSQASSSEPTVEEGVKVSKIYQEIISEPSTSKPKPSSQEAQRNQPKSAVKPKQNYRNNPPPPLVSLLKLAEANQSATLQSLLESYPEIDLNARDEFGWTLLMVAACAGATETVRLLLSKGADLLVTDKKGHSAISLAHKKNRRSVIEVIENFEKELKRPKVACDKKHHQPGYCEPCGFNYQDQTVHTKSIGHLLSTAEGVQERTHYGIPESNVGFQLMLKTGWDKQSGLGPEGKGHKFPVKTVLKQDRVGLGSEGESKKARITHFGPGDTRAVERPVKKDPEVRTERKSTKVRKEEARRKRTEVRKEINFRRELGSL